MNDHIGDTNEMSDTPRMKAAQMTQMEHGTGDVWRVGCDIERELNAAYDRIRLLISERDTARMQVDQRVSLREEFRELLGTDDVQTGITVVCDLKQLASVRLDYIKQLTTEIERLTAKVAQLYEGAEEAKQRIKRLEEAGDALANNHNPFTFIDWQRAKEDKP